MQYLLRRAYRLQAGQTILFHAAAGGCGLIACQWAKHLGATVIGTVGTPEKAELAKAHGCDHAVVYTKENFVEQVKTLTNGEGVPVVFDSVGKDTFMDSLDCLQPRGTMVSFGNASGAVEAFSPGVLAAKGSLYLTRPTLATYMRARAEIEDMTTELFDVVSAGAVRVEVNQTYALEDAAQAHRDLEGRQTTGRPCCLLARSGSVGRKGPRFRRRSLVVVRRSVLLAIVGLVVALAACAGGTVPSAETEEPGWPHPCRTA